MQTFEPKTLFLLRSDEKLIEPFEPFCFCLLRINNWVFVNKYITMKISIAVTLICLLLAVTAEVTSVSATDSQPGSNTPLSYRALVLKLYAILGFGTKLDQATAEYVYDSSIPFKTVALDFANKVMDGYRAAIKKQYGFELKAGLSQEEITILLDTKLRQFGTLPLKQFIFEFEALLKETATVVEPEKEVSLQKEETLAHRIMKPLGRLYDRTYGTVIKQGEPEKYLMVVGCYNYSYALKDFFDPRRKVFGMKTIESMPKTFQYFHSRSKKIISQYDQDGVIEAIFEAIKDNHKNGKYFVEVGGGGQEDNTGYLRDKLGWQGKLFNSGTYFMGGRTGYPVTDQYVGPENAIRIFQKYNVPKEFDFLSIDVDSRDCWIWAAIAKNYNPAVVSVQFNSNFGFDVSASVPRLSQGIWAQDNSHYDKHYGCSFRAALNIGKKHGYVYVWHHPFTDVFFVKEGLLPADLPSPDPAATFDPIPLHLIDTRFKQYVLFDPSNIVQPQKLLQSQSLPEKPAPDLSPPANANSDPTLKDQSLLGYLVSYVLGIASILVVLGVYRVWRSKSRAAEPPQGIEMRSSELPSQTSDR